MELILPVASSLFGIFVGFSLNLLRDMFKSRKENTNKMTCIAEDIDRIRLDASRVFIEAVKHLDAMGKGSLIVAHRMPGEINSPYVDKHFVEIAHLYTQQQRHNIVSMLPTLKDINAIIKSLGDPETKADLVSYKRQCMNAGNLAIFCIERCDVVSDGPPKYHEDWFSIAMRLNVESEFINELRQRGTPFPEKVTD
ncbi:hypothetical protein [Pseudomonas sp. BF-B-27]|uniref:hypothetical protein n=1 Tax=Pseudomonas sp. BF-B-27 TaxID=2832354 RepID=UPI001CBE052B|nr:hypothetical protein [Pseudomonas sp. BF-B-27]